MSALVVNAPTVFRIMLVPPPHLGARSEGVRPPRMSVRAFDGWGKQSVIQPDGSAGHLGGGPTCCRGPRLATHPIVEARTPQPDAPRQSCFDVFAEVMRVVGDAKVPFAIGGSFAFHYYTRFPSTTKDLDLFLNERDVRQAVAALVAAGF